MWEGNGRSEEKAVIGDLEVGPIYENGIYAEKYAKLGEVPPGTAYRAEEPSGFLKDG